MAQSERTASCSGEQPVSEDWLDRQKSTTLQGTATKRRHFKAFQLVSHKTWLTSQLGKMF